eukprot:UN25117
MRLRTRVWAQAPKPSSFAEQVIFLQILELKNGYFEIFSKMTLLKNYLYKIEFPLLLPNFS